MALNPAYLPYLIQQRGQQANGGLSTPMGPSYPFKTAGGGYAGYPQPGGGYLQTTANGYNPAASSQTGWRPSFLNTPAVPYPSSYYGGGRGGGGGGGGYGGPSMASAYAYEPSMFQGPGAYYPGHQAEFQAQQTGANLGILAGRLQPDTRQPAQMAAALARDQARGIGPMGQRSYTIGRGPNQGARVGYGGYGGGSAGGIAGDFQRGFDDARQANDARYRDILEGYDSRMGYLQNAGAQENADINQAYDAQKASGLQSLTGRGLGNSTIVNTMGMGYDRERADSIGRLEERLRNQYLNTQKDTLDFMERRTDSYPDLNMLGQIGQMQGQSGGGLPQGYQVSMSTLPGLGGGSYYGYGGGGGAAVPQQQGGLTPQQIRAGYVRNNRSSTISPAEWSQRLKAQAQGNAENDRIRAASARAITSNWFYNSPYGSTVTSPNTGVKYINSYGGLVPTR